MSPLGLDIRGRTTDSVLGVARVEVGKSFYVDLDYPDVESVREEIERLCDETLSNPLIEAYSWEALESA